MPANFPLHLFEEHSSTLPVWWQYRSRPRTAVYLDAHLDLQQTSVEQIQALEACEDIEQFRALESPHHLNPSSRYAYGIESFLYPASQLKLIDRLIWVAPPHIPRTYSAPLLEYIQQMDGISFDELCGFVEVGEGALRGRLMGLDITICEFSSLHKLDIDDEYYLDVDIDYFVTVPEDRLWTDPGALIKQVLEQLGEPVVATVSLAVGSGFTPLAMRFTGDYICAVLAHDPSATAHFQNLYEALTMIDRGELQQAISLCEQNVANKADCAASHYVLGMAQTLAGDDAGKDNTARAAELDNAYAYDLSREATGFPNRNRPLHAEQLKALLTHLESLPSADPASALAEVAMGQLFASTGMLKQAWQLLQKQDGELAHHGDLSMAIARGILASNEPQKAKQLLEDAAKQIKNRTAATLYLGDLAFHAGDIEQALSHYRKVSDYTPAWILPLERQLVCVEKLGDVAEHEILQALIKERRQVLSRLAG